MQRRRGAAVFAQRRVELVRQGHRHARQPLGQQRGHLQLMGRIDDRPQQADGHGLDTRRSSAASSDVVHRGRVERADDAAVGADPLGDLEGERARHIGAG